MTPTNIVDQLKRDEAFRPNVYPDTRGFATIGYGHNLTVHPLTSNVVVPITEAQGDAWLREDLKEVTDKLVKLLPWSVNLPSVIFGVLQNMAFNMGVLGLLGFHHDLADTQAGNYAKAAMDMQASEWYTQVGTRAVRLVNQMRTGEWQ